MVYLNFSDIIGPALAAHTGEHYPAVPLANLRRRLKVSQKDVAARMGVSQSRVCQIERGDAQNFGVGILLTYVRALGGTLEVTAVVGERREQLL